MFMINGYSDFFFFFGDMVLLFGLAYLELVEMFLPVLLEYWDSGCGPLHQTLSDLLMRTKLRIESIVRSVKLVWSSSL